MEVAVTAPTMGTCVHVTVGEHDTVGMMRKQVADELGIGEAFLQLILEEADIDDDAYAAGYVGSGEAEAVVLHQKCDAKETLADLQIPCDHSGLTKVLGDAGLGHHVATLHEAGVDVMEKEYADSYPLAARAVKNHNIAALQSAMGLGCSVGATFGENGYSTFHIAAIQGADECMEWLLQHHDAKHFKSLRSTAGFTPMHCAASFNNTRCLELLAKHGADVNAKTVNGMTPLFSACHGGRQAVEKLLDLGAYLFTKDKEGFTVLHSRKCTSEMVDMFTSRGLSINTQSASGSTPLHSIIYNDATSTTIEHYIAKGAAVNQKNNEGKTPLHFAVLHNHAAIHVLLRHGAATNIRDTEGRIPLHYIGTLLNPHFTELVERSERSANTRDLQGRTPLHYARESRMVKYLVKHGADPTLYDVYRQTPAYYKAADVRRQLFELGCPRATVDIYGFTPVRSVSGAERIRRDTSMPWAKPLELSELPA